MRNRRHYDRVSLGSARDNHSCFQHVRVVPYNAHVKVAELQHIGVSRLELETYQPREFGVRPHWADKHKPRTIADTTGSMHDYVARLGQSNVVDRRVNATAQPGGYNAPRE